MAAASPFGELLREDLRGEGGASNLAFNEKVTARNVLTIMHSGDPPPQGERSTSSWATNLPLCVRPIALPCAGAFYSTPAGRAVGGNELSFL